MYSHKYTLNQRLITRYQLATKVKNLKKTKKKNSREFLAEIGEKRYTILRGEWGRILAPKAAKRGP